MKNFKLSACVILVVLSVSACNISVTLPCETSGEDVNCDFTGVESSQLSSEPASSLPESSSSLPESSSSKQDSSSSLTVSSSEQQSSSESPHVGVLARPADCDSKHDCAVLNFDSIPEPLTGYDEIRIRQAATEPRLNADIGSFRTECEFSHYSFDDPLVYPGKSGASHLHLYSGNVTTNAFSDVTGLAQYGNSTCKGGIANRSAYWLPVLMDMQAGEPVTPLNSIWYYKEGYRGLSTQGFGPLPVGLAMISHNSHWLCSASLNGKPNYEKYPSIPTECPSGERLTMVVVFPQCWNEQDTYLSDQSHVTNPSNRSCPESHPYRLPEITLNVRYSVTPEMNINALRLSSDMMTDAAGSTAHADWINGWLPEISNTFIENCLNKQTDCHANLLGDGRILY